MFFQFWNQMPAHRKISKQILEKSHSAIQHRFDQKPLSESIDVVYELAYGEINMRHQACRLSILLLVALSKKLA
jgi:hypothetical protein